MGQCATREQERLEQQRSKNIDKKWRRHEKQPKEQRLLVSMKYFNVNHCGC
jgi:hypothetical protein